MAGPDWNAQAKLLRIDGQPATRNWLGRGGPVRDGELIDLVNEVLEQPAGERWRYSIVQSGAPLLDSVSIQALAIPSDFRRQKAAENTQR